MENPNDVYFCKRCGLGLALLEVPGIEELQDVDVGALWRSGIIGGLIGIVLTALLSTALQIIARWLPSITGKYIPFLLSVLVWRVGPVLFAVGAGLWVYLKGRRQGLAGHWHKAVLGSLLGVVLGFFVVAWSGKLAIIMFLLFCPFFAARFVFGLMAPWWSGKKIAVTCLLTAGISVTIVVLTKTHAYQRLDPAVPTWNVNALLLESNERRRLYLGTQGLGVLGSDDRGEHWQVVSGLAERRPVAKLCSLGPGVSWAIMGDGSAYALGSSFHGTRVNPPPQGFATVYAIHSAERDLLLAGTTDGVYCSTDGGQNWELRSQGLSSIVHGKQYGHVSTIEVTNKNEIHAGIFGGGVFHSSDLGLNWQPCGHGLETPWVTTLLCDSPGDEQEYAVTSDGLYFNGGKCETWNKAPNPLAAGSLLGISWVRRATDRMLVAASPFGMAWRQAGAEDWESLFTLETPVKAFAVNDDGEIAVAAGSGIYRRGIDNGAWQKLVDLSRMDFLLSKERNNTRKDSE